MSSEHDKIMNGSPNDDFEAFEKLTSGLKVPASKKGKEAVWDSIMQSIEEESVKETKIVPLFSSKRLWYSVAASVLVFVTVVSLSYRYSTVEILVAKGQTASVSLPDNSEVTLNSDSKIEYRKYGWLSNRELTLVGEAFFNVKHGNKFTVNTANKNKVIVTGTKFNVLSRGDHFDVKCYDGSVIVQTSKSKSIPLPKGFAYAVNNDEEISSPITVDSFAAPKWIVGEFFFVNTPLNQVFEELNRQYNVEVAFEGVDLERNYTGFFKRDELTKSLDLICIPMELTYLISSDSSTVTIKK